MMLALFWNLIRLQQEAWVGKSGQWLTARKRVEENSLLLTAGAIPEWLLIQLAATSASGRQPLILCFTFQEQLQKCIFQTLPLQPIKNIGLCNQQEGV